jgi:hypothetical protein
MEMQPKFFDVPRERFENMSSQEVRWLNNTKKAFLASDMAYDSGNREDNALQEFCKAIDSAQNLYFALLGEKDPNRDNKKRFVAFLEQDIPSAIQGGLDVSLTNPRTDKKKAYGAAEVMYEIRCMMLHENENLRLEEAPDYHVLIDWNLDGRTFIYDEGKTIICDGKLLWNRIREVLAKFITYVDCVRTHSETGRGGVRIKPPLGSIKPDS